MKSHHLFANINHLHQNKKKKRKQQLKENKFELVTLTEFLLEYIYITRDIRNEWTKYIGTGTQ